MNLRTVLVVSDADIVKVRAAARSLAAHLGFRGSDVVMIVAAVSEVAQNILQFGQPGEIAIGVLQGERLRAGLQIVARDEGPGIADVAQAMTDGFSTSSGLGLGLPGARRLMDEFWIDSRPGFGTTVTMRKWLR
jgi:anti-sigma regulatory factor (Ser/Thr protein kinase)